VGGWEALRSAARRAGAYEVRLEGQHSFLEGMKQVLGPVAPPPEVADGDGEEAPELGVLPAMAEPPVSEELTSPGEPSGLSVARLAWRRRSPSSSSRWPALSDRRAAPALRGQVVAGPATDVL